MKKILMISTGGTIASEPTESGLAPAVTGEQMIDMIPELDGLCEIYCSELLNLDSTNMQPEDWATLASGVFTALSLFDGIVITHGTDTMPYTSAALSFMLHNLHKPVVITGAQLPIEDPQTDGKRNILDAFRVAADGRLKGVYIVFDGHIIRGVNGRKTCSRNFHAMESLNRDYEGRIVDGEVVLTHEPAPEPILPTKLYPDLCPDVLLIKLTPAAKPELITAAADLGYKAVVIEAFGLGGIPNVRRNLLPAITSLVEKKIPVVVTTQCTFDGADLSVYDVGVLAARLGVLSGKNMITEAIVTKLMCILGLTDDYNTILELFQKDIMGEFNE
jgi:L-asparaginase